MLKPFSTNADYLAELRSLLALHRLWVVGRGESPEADAIRDASDRTWYALSENEKERLRGLSEDLNTICDYVAEQQTLDMNPQAQARLIEAEEARRNGEWDRSLELMRKIGSYLAPAVLANIRGVIWSSAGDHQTAEVFFQHAASLEPSNGQCKNSIIDGILAVPREVGSV